MINCNTISSIECYTRIQQVLQLTYPTATRYYTQHGNEKVQAKFDLRQGHSYPPRLRSRATMNVSTSCFEYRANQPWRDKISETNSITVDQYIMYNVPLCIAQRLSFVFTSISYEPIVVQLVINPPMAALHAASNVLGVDQKHLICSNFILSDTVTRFIRPIFISWIRSSVNLKLQHGMILIKCYKWSLNIGYFLTGNE